MKISKLVSVVVFAGLAVAAASASADPSPNASPPKISCKGGALTLTPQNGWLLNNAAPWKWDQLLPTSSFAFTSCDKDGHCTSGTAKGSSCTGTVTAYVCTAGNCNPPMKVPVTGS